MSSPSELFECHWRSSRRLLLLYALVLCGALIALWVAAVPSWAKALGLLLCLAHCGWVLPRYVLLSHAAAFTGLRHDVNGWQLCSQQAGWQHVQLCRDSLALPVAVVLRFRLPGERRVRGLCIAADAMEPTQHRRLRVRLKFSRDRWAVPE